ncbi:MULTISPECIES: hypothetical protein [Nocardioides]|jgi:hypothetical protein|uniref:hypothetical protein n=1 Tax=Nocardioides TaxID=1839 RepID=UPI0003F57238|nr:MULTISPECIES: hypothetical protein [Nocardioides]
MAAQIDDPWHDPDASDDDVDPGSVFPGAGRHVDDAERLAALAAEPAGNAEQNDTVDTDAIDSRAHETNDE